ncbi:MAG: acyltransferase [Anaerolineales bacterium]
MNRIKELDGIRGIAIFLVLLWHYVFVIADVNIFNSQYGKYLDLFSLTWSGVDLFFVLSGFLIVGILLEARTAQNYFSTFYIRRALRILPLYFILIGLFLLLRNKISNDWLFSQNIKLWNYITFTQNFLMPSNGFGANWLGVTWSLAVEEQFYLILPLMIWFFPPKKLSYVFLYLICLAPILRVIFDYLAAYVLPFARADSILMGGLIAIVYKDLNFRKILIENYWHLCGFFFVFFLGFIVCSFYLNDIGSPFLHFWLAIFYSLFILISILQPGKIVRIVVSNQFFIWLGLRSYAIYLFHQPVLGLVFQYLNKQIPPSFSNSRDFLAVGISLIIVFILSELSFRFFESVFLLYSKRFQYKN